MGDLFSQQISFYEVEILFSFGKWKYDLIKDQSQHQNANCIDISQRKLIEISYFVKIRGANKKDLLVSPKLEIIVNTI